MPKLETYERADGQFGWRVKAGNGEILTYSEAYTRLEDAERGARDLLMDVLELVDEAGGIVSAVPIEHA